MAFISWNIFLRLRDIDVFFLFFTEETKWHLLCCCHDNSFTADLILIKTEISSFSPNQGLFTPANLNES